MTILPNGQAQITNNQTGETKVVSASDLGQYSPALVTQYQQLTGKQLAPPTPTATPSTGVQPTTPTQSGLPTGAGSTITGHTLPEISQALTKAKAAGDGAAVKSITDDYDREYQYQKDYTDKLNVTNTKKSDAYNKATGTIENLLQQYTDLPGTEKGRIGGNIAQLPVIGGGTQASEYEKQRKGLATALAGIAGGGAGSGLRITMPEIQGWMNLLPSPGKTDGQIKNDIISLERQLRGSFGQGLDPAYLNTYGVTENDIARKGTPAKNTSQQMVPGMNITEAQQAKNADQIKNSFLPDLKRTGQGLVDTAKGVGQQILSGKDFGTIGAETAGNMAKSTVQSYKNVLSDPEYARTHPVETFMDMVTPFLGLGKLGKVSDAAAGAGEAGAVGTEAGALPKIPDLNPLQKGIVKAADIVNSGGSKEYIARQASKEAPVLQNKILMDEGILTKPTETGRITATAQSLDKYGSQLGDVYRSSDRVFKDGQLGDAIDQGLKGKGYDPKTIEFIKKYINTQGNFDISSQQTLVPMDKAWQTAQTLEKNPPKMLKNPESAAQYRQLSNDTARIIRGQLGDKLPETKPLNSKYAALKDYFDTKLPDNPQGAEIAGKGIVGSVASAGKSIINPILNTAYNAAGGLPKVGGESASLVRDMRFKQGNPQFRK